MSTVLDSAMVADKVRSLPGQAAVGRSFPLGASLVPGGVNFSVFSRSAAAVELLLFDREDDNQPARVIPIDSATNRTYHYWHVFVPGRDAGQTYGYRVPGPLHPPIGWRFEFGQSRLNP